MRSASFRLLLIIIFLFTAIGQARTFKNAYISFEMLDNWKCKLEQTEWVCRAEDPQESKEAVIILTAKEKGPTDNFPIYMDHMAKPMTLNLKTGGTTQSTVTMPPREEIINDQKWLDGLHTNSEVQNYYTRYLATIKDQIAILITFSVHNKYYAKHRSHFMDTVRSLRVIATKDLLSRPDLGPLRGSGEVLGSGIGQAMPGDMLAADDEAGGDHKKGLLQNEMVLGGGLLLLVIAAYVGIKMYQRKNG